MVRHDTPTAEEWQAATFTIRFTKSNGQNSVAPGLAVRVPSAARHCVICTYCPHEFCIIRLEQQQLRCPCHDSRFDPERNGALLAGVAPHDAWQLSYRLTRTGGNYSPACRKSLIHLLEDAESEQEATT